MIKNRINHNFKSTPNYSHLNKIEKSTKKTIQYNFLDDKSEIFLRPLFVRR